MRDLTCREFVGFLDDYLGGVLDDSELAVFNSHLAACPSCVAYLKTYAASIGAARGALLRQDDLPEDVPEGLLRAILTARPKG